MIKPLSPSTETVKQFLVERHSGRRAGSWRTILETDDAEEARLAYEGISVALRQGAVRLTRHGTIANWTVAPNLRTKW